jgi:hypothetical protein
MPRRLGCALLLFCVPLGSHEAIHSARHAVTKSKARCDHPVTVQWLKMRPKGAARALSRRLDRKCFYRGQPFSQSLA